MASLQTTIPILFDEIRRAGVDCIAFPDDGASKRFAHMFAPLQLEMVTCGKTRDGDKRVITVQDGNPDGKKVLIVDDLVQTGGTLYECGVALKALVTNNLPAGDVFVVLDLLEKIVYDLDFH
eukprot:evm.model.NODE_24274_length_29257_cov_20.527943.5